MLTVLSKWVYLQRENFATGYFCVDCGLTIGYPGQCYYCRQEWYHNEPIQENNRNRNPCHRMLCYIRRIGQTMETIERWAVIGVTAAWVIGMIFLIVTAGGTA